jgi:hypothetical protein
MQLESTKSIMRRESSLYSNTSAIDLSIIVFHFQLPRTAVDLARSSYASAGPRQVVRSCSSAPPRTDLEGKLADHLSDHRGGDRAGVTEIVEVVDWPPVENTRSVDEPGMISAPPSRLRK